VLPHPRDDKPTTSPIFAAPCARCGEQMRLTVIEPHNRFAKLDNQRFVCDCGATASYVILRND
jgi:hypothetical protein